MKEAATPHRTANRYLDRLTKALPGKTRSGTKPSREFWPDGAKLVISISLQFEAGAQPAIGASSPFHPLRPGILTWPSANGTTMGCRKAFPVCWKFFKGAV
jgi:hypothetical protein